MQKVKTFVKSKKKWSGKIKWQKKWKIFDYLNTDVKTEFSLSIQTHWYPHKFMNKSHSNPWTQQPKSHTLINNRQIRYTVDLFLKRIKKSESNFQELLIFKIKRDMLAMLLKLRWNCWSACWYETLKLLFFHVITFDQHII